MIGNGAIHSESVMRLLAYVAQRANEGVLGSGDLKVTALGTPGSSVLVAPGAAAMLGRGTSQVSEMYAARMPTQDTANIGATGSGAGRSDLIIGRIEDPNISGSPWSQPPDIAHGPYVYTRVISGVPSTTRSVLDLNLGYTACTLARVDIPASTSAITQAMIVDLRKIANANKERQLYTINPSATVQLGPSGTTGTSVLADWFGSWQVAVPAWATQVVALLNIAGVRHTRLSTSVNGSASGQVRAALGTLYTQATNYDYETTTTNNTARYAAAAADTMPLSPSARGTTQTLRIQGSRAGGNVPVSVDGGSFASVDLEFQQTAA